MAIDQKAVQGSVTLRKMKSGATASISLSSDRQLFQLYMKNTAGGYDFAPAWSQSANAPTIKVNAATSSGSQIIITDVQWKINGQLVSTFLTSNEYEITAGPDFTLKIKANIAGQNRLNFNSGTLLAEITFKDGIDGTPQRVDKTEIIRVQEASESGYTVFLHTNNKDYVDADATTPVDRNTTIYAECLYGLADATDDVTFYWLKSVGEAVTPSTTPSGKIYNVTPDDVDGTQLFVCRAFAGGSEVDAEAILIRDIGDPLQIRASAQQKNGSTYSGNVQNNVSTVDVAESNDSTEITFEVVKKDGTAPGVTPTAWKVQKSHAGTDGLIKRVYDSNSVQQDYTMDAASESDDSPYHTITTGSAASAAITVYDVDFYTSGSSASGNVVKDEVIVTATATL